MHNRTMLEQQDIYRLAGETGANHSTVQRWARDGEVNKTTDYALRAACKKLGITPPDRPSDKGATGDGHDPDEATGTDG